jgi:hypothetical protein
MTDTVKNAPVKTKKGAGAPFAVFSALPIDYAKGSELQCPNALGL